MEKYQEIQDLYEYCKKLKVSCKIEPLFDGFKLTVPGGDFVQHCHSWGSVHGRIEPAICCDRDFTGCTLSIAKELIDKYYKKENKKNENFKRGLFLERF